MIKRLLLGAAIGAFGKKLYDEGKLDPYIAKAKAKLADHGLSDKAQTSKTSPKTSPG